MNEITGRSLGDCDLSADLRSRKVILSYPFDDVDQVRKNLFGDHDFLAEFICITADPFPNFEQFTLEGGFTSGDGLRDSSD